MRVGPTDERTNPFQRNEVAEMDFVSKDANDASIPPPLPLSASVSDPIGKRREREREEERRDDTVRIFGRESSLVAAASLLL